MNMKRILLGAAAFMLPACSAEIFAEEPEGTGRSCRIYGADAVITIPEGYSVLTQKMEEAEEFAAGSSFSVKDAYGQLFRNGFDLEAASGDLSREYCVRITGNEGNFHTMTDEEFEEEYKEAEEILEAQYRDMEGVELLEVFPFETEEFRIIVYSLNYTAADLYQWVGVTDSPRYDMNIIHSCRPADPANVSQEELDAEKEEYLRVLASLRNEPTPGPEETHRALFPAAGAVYSIPDAWRCTTDVYNGLDVMEIEKKTGEEKDRRIYVITQDLYPAALEDGFGDSREALDAVYAGDNAMAAVMGAEASGIRTETFGPEKYYLTDRKDKDGTLLQYYIVKGGILYMYQFNGDADDTYYPEFENILSTAEYPRE